MAASSPERDEPGPCTGAPLGQDARPDRKRSGFHQRLSSRSCSPQLHDIRMTSEHPREQREATTLSTQNEDGVVDADTVDVHEPPQIHQPGKRAQRVNQLTYSRSHDSSLTIIDQVDDRGGRLDLSYDDLEVARVDAAGVAAANCRLGRKRARMRRWNSLSRRRDRASALNVSPMRSGRGYRPSRS